MIKPALHILSEKQGSIGEITKDLIPHLRKKFEITIEGEDNPINYNTLFCHFINPAAINSPNFEKFKKKILIQPIDGTDIHKDIIKLFNKFDLIITPANAGRQIMMKNGVTVPIIIIPNFYKDDLLVPITSTEIKELPKGKFIFYHESTSHPRKGMEILYEGFVKAFSDTPDADKVVLVVKDNYFNERTYEKNEALKRKIISLQKQFQNPAQIIKISQNLKEETLKKLWHNTNVYVSMARIEGFGIPLLRMAVLQKPIISLDCPVSGYIDYLNKTNSYLIPSKLTLAREEFMFLYTKKTQWGTPKLTDVVFAFKKSRQDCLSGKQKVVGIGSLKPMHINEVVKKYIVAIQNV